MKITVEDLKNVIDGLHEFNPMMGHRGCRLAVTYPEIAEMQTTAVINAAIAVNKEHPDYNIVPEIMIPPRWRGQGAQICQGRRHRDGR